MLSDNDFIELLDATPPGDSWSWRGIQAHHVNWHPPGREKPGLSRTEAESLLGALRLRQLRPVSVSPQGEGLEVTAPVNSAEELERRFPPPEGFVLAGCSRKAWQGQRSWRLGGGKVQLLGFTARYVPDVARVLRKYPARETFVPSPKLGDLRLAVLRPDTQHGFVRHKGGLEPIHDRRAIDASNKVIAWLDARFGVDHLFDLGDGLDAETLSSYLPRPEAFQLFEPSLWSKGYDLERAAEAAPSATRVYVPSNHDDRPRKKIVQFLSELYGVRAYKQQAAVLSIENLLALRESGWAFTEECPEQPGVRVRGGDTHGTEAWCFDNKLRVTHGDSAAKNAAEKHLSDAFSTVFGHVHRHVMAHKQVWHAGQLTSRFATSPGCLCRIDAWGPPPVSLRRDWQQGLQLVWYDGKRLWPEWVEIHEGVAFWRGERFVGTYSEDDLEAWRAAT